MPGFPRTLKVLIDCGASENYARKESMMMNKEKLEAAVASSDGRATVRFVSDETYFVIDLDERWDLILGMGWLEKHQPTINWKLKTISKSLDANEALGLESNEPTPNETKSLRRVTLAVEGLATHGHDIDLVKAAGGRRIASADEDCDGTGDTMTSEDHVDIWGVDCDLERAPRDMGAGSGVDPERKKDLDASWELNRETQWNTWKNANSTREAPCFGITREQLNALRDRCRQTKRRVGRKNFRLNNVAIVRGVTPEELVLSQCNLEELPQAAEEIVKLPEMSFTEFEEALRRQEVVSIALIQAVD
ncbi:hypothetical protein AC1031_021286 [Aphanomyces cochlioides]|nr:hypothetical protein AC1031_021286 [Aphanomyces cochlioides]